MEGQLLLPERAESVFYHHLKAFFETVYQDRADRSIVIPSNLMTIAQKFAKPGGYIISHPLVHGSKWTARLMMMAINEAIITDHRDQYKNFIIIDDIAPLNPLKFSAERAMEAGNRLRSSAKQLEIAITRMNENLRELKVNTPPKHKPNFRYRNKFTKGRR